MPRLTRSTKLNRDAMSESDINDVTMNSENNSIAGMRTSPAQLTHTGESFLAGDGASDPLQCPTPTPPSLPHSQGSEAGDGSQHVNNKDSPHTTTNLTDPASVATNGSYIQTLNLNTCSSDMISHSSSANISSTHTTHHPQLQAIDLQTLLLRIDKKIEDQAQRCNERHAELLQHQAEQKTELVKKIDDQARFFSQQLETFSKTLSGHSETLKAIDVTLTEHSEKFNTLTQNQATFRTEMQNEMRESIRTSFEQYTLFQDARWEKQSNAISTDITKMISEAQEATQTQLNTEIATVQSALDQTNSNVQQLREQVSQSHAVIGDKVKVISDTLIEKEKKIMAHMATIVPDTVIASVKSTVDSHSEILEEVQQDITKNNQTLSSIASQLENLSQSVEELKLAKDDASDVTQPAALSETEDARGYNDFTLRQRKTDRLHSEHINEMRPHNRNTNNGRYTEQQFPFGNAHLQPIQDTVHPLIRTSDPRFMSDISSHEQSFSRSVNHSSSQHYDNFNFDRFLALRKFKVFRNGQNDLHPVDWIQQFTYTFPPSWPVERQLDLITGYLEGEPAMRMRSIARQCRSIEEFRSAFLEAYWSKVTQRSVKDQIISFPHFSQTNFASPSLFFDHLVKTNQYLMDPYPPSELIHQCISKLPRPLRLPLLTGQQYDDIVAFRSMLQLLEVQDAHQFIDNGSNNNRNNRGRHNNSPHSSYHSEFQENNSPASFHGNKNPNHSFQNSQHNGGQNTFQNTNVAHPIVPQQTHGNNQNFSPQSNHSNRHYNSRDQGVYRNNYSHSHRQQPYQNNRHHDGQGSRHFSNQQQFGNRNFSHNNNQHSQSNNQFSHGNNHQQTGDNQSNLQQSHSANRNHAAQQQPSLTLHEPDARFHPPTQHFSNSQPQRTVTLVESSSPINRSHNQDTTS